MHSPSGHAFTSSEQKTRLILNNLPYLAGDIWGRWVFENLLVSHSILQVKVHFAAPKKTTLLKRIFDASNAAHMNYRVRDIIQFSTHNYTYITVINLLPSLNKTFEFSVESFKPRNEERQMFCSSDWIIVYTVRVRKHFWEPGFSWPLISFNIGLIAVLFFLILRYLLV